jgi:drug/metabolite transporter (DMT)-like permease
MSTYLKTNWVQRQLVPIAFANIYVIWGSTFLAISYGLKGFPPFMLSGFRFLIAGIILIAWRHLKGEKTYSLRNWGRNAVIGTLILTGGTGLVAWGEQYVSSTEAAIAIATGPFWFIAIDRKNWKTYFANKFILAGLVVGFTGLLLFLQGSVSAEIPGTNSSLKITAFVVLALSSISWVLGSLFSRNFPASHSSVMNSAQQLFAAGVGSLLVSTFRSEWSGFSVSAVPASSWIGLTFLILFGSIVAYLSYIWLLSVRPPALVSTHTYINPVVAVFAGWIFSSQVITTGQSFGLIVILVGVLFTNARSYQLNLRRKVQYRRLGRKFRYLVSPLYFAAKSR